MAATTVDEQFDLSIKHQARSILDEGLSGLQFDSTLEQRFSAWFSYRYCPINRIYLLAGALTLAILTIVDQRLTPDIIEALLTVRVPAILFIGLIFVVSHVPFVIPLLPALLVLVACTVHVSLLVAASYAATQGHFYYQGGAIVSVIFACLVLRQRFHYVLPLVLLLWFTQIIGMHFFMTLAFADFIEGFVIYTAVCILTVIVCFRNEYEIRRHFLMHILLTQTNGQPSLFTHNAKQVFVEKQQDYERY